MRKSDCAIRCCVAMDGEGNAGGDIRQRTTSTSADPCNVESVLNTKSLSHERLCADGKSVDCINRRRERQLSPRKSRSTARNLPTALTILLAAAPVAMAETCISLSGSTTCSAFDSASISTNSDLTGLLYVAIDIVLFAPISLTHHRTVLFSNMSQAERLLIQNLRLMFLRVMSSLSEMVHPIVDSRIILTFI